MADSDRVAELKRKMQEAAERNKAWAAAKEAASPQEAAPAASEVPNIAPAEAAASVSADPAPAAEAALVAEAVAGPSAEVVARAGSPAVAAMDVEVPTAGPEVEPAPAAVAVVAAEAIATPSAPAAQAPAAPIASVTTQPNANVGSPSTSGATNGAGNDSALEGTVYAPQVLTPEEIAKRDMNRREFLTYAWGGALLLVVGASGFGLFQFAYPRFKAGEFGGKFFVGPVAEVPSVDAPPLPFTAGKFWLVNSAEEGVKALYMVCTHLGCLYKWEPSTVRFECPCHGSKFSKDGYYIEGPAPRSLDRFVTAEENGILVVDTGAKIPGAPSALSPDRAVPI